jgi:hypothetical protein
MAFSAMENTWWWRIKKTIFVWSVETGTLAFSLKGHKDVIR